MKKILMILASERFRDIEYITPRAFFEAAGCEVHTTSTTLKSTGRFGFQVHHPMVLSDVKPDDYQGVFLVGGIGSLQYLEDEQAKKIVHSFYVQKKPVAAICAAPRNLLHWGMLKGKMVTGHNGDGSFYAFALQHGAHPMVEQTTVFDGGILTGNGPEASEECALKFLDLLQEAN
ncbi:MAG: DJ-1/PfpI family protein [Cytophagaceae bacterium]|jgi:putative intracellular protease/amidase|nr:DJ-1/PfpI family protein [Cytophagaceae bacterium]